MKHTEGSVGSRRPRRIIIGAAALAGGMLLLGSVAWACTQRVGTLLVCRPPASTYVSGTQCGKITSTSQTGTPTALKAGSQISVKAVNFYAKRYQVTFRVPGSNASCFIPGVGVDVLTSVSPALGGSAAAGQNTFMGPSFQAEFRTSSVTSTGQAKVCSMDVPDRVTGQVVNMTVV